MSDREFVERQMLRMEVSLADYLSNKSNLQTLIGNFEFIRDSDNWLEKECSKHLNSILIDLESFNAELIENGKLPDRNAETELENSVNELRKWLVDLKGKKGF